MAETRGFKQLSKDLLNLDAAISKANVQLANLIRSGASAAEVNKFQSQTIDPLIGKYQKLASEVETYSKNVGSGTSSVKKFNDRVKELGNGAKKASSSIVSLTSKTNTLAKSAENAKNQNKGFLETLGSAFTSKKIASSLGTVLRFVGIYSALSTAVSFAKTTIVGSVQAFVNFEEKIGRLSAVSGASRQQLEGISSAIRESAVQTRFTATEVGDLAISLSKLGATAIEVERLILPVSSAAQALSEDLNVVGETVLKVNNQFGLSAAESGTTAAVLVASINNSALSLNSFATAIQYIGPLARQAGVTFEETAAYMQVLANSGFTASRIGTGLRKIFIELKEEGKTLSQSLRELSERNIGLADAVELVGDRAAGQLLVLSSNVEIIEEMSSQSYLLTSALSSSARQMSTTSGAVKILGSAFDELLISIGKTITKSEFFLNLIGLLSVESEATARAYKLINDVALETPGKIDEVSKAVINGVITTQQAARSLFANASDKDAQLFDSVLKKIIGKGKLSLEEATKVFEFLAKEQPKKASQALEEILSQNTKMSEEQKNLIRFTLAGVKEISLETLIAQSQAFIGANRLVEQNVQQILLSAAALEERKEVVAEFEDELKLIEGLDSGEAKRTKAINLEVDVRTKMLKLVKQNADASIGLIQLSDEEIASNENKIQGLQTLLNILSEYTADVKEQTDESAKLQRQEENRINGLIRAKREEIEAARQALLIELEAAKSKGDTNRVREIETELLLKEKTAFEELNQVIKESTILTEEQKTGLLSAIRDLDIQPSDLLDVGKKIAKAFNETFKGAELDPQEFSLEQSDFIESQIEQYIKAFGDSISEEDKKRLRDILLNATYAQAENGSKEAAEKLSKELKRDITAVLNEALSAGIDALDAFNETKYDNLKRQFDAEKELIRERSSFEQDVLKAQLDSQMISQEEYASRLEQIKKKEIQRQNKVERDIFETEKKRDLTEAGTDLAEAIAKAFINEIAAGREFPKNVAFAGLTSGIAIARYAAQVSAINKRIFIPKRFAEGGMVYGPSHEEGGIPFTVQGRSGYEMEGGEYIVNKKSAAKYKSILDQINETRYTPKYKFATGGIVNVQNDSARSLELLEAIAEATTGTALNTGRPVRAFVSSSDLQNDTNARRIKDRNSNI